jgi:peroxiredoxin
MSKLVLCFFSFLLILSCSQGKSNGNGDETNESGVQISGEVKNPQQGNILLQELQNNQMVTIDTISLTDKNTFKAVVDVKEPGFYRLNLYEKQFVNFILDESDIQIVADGASQEGIAEVKGSKDTDHFNKVNDIMKDFQEDVQQLEVAFQDASTNQNQMKVDSLRNVYLEMEKEKTESIKSAINKMDNSLAALYAVNFLDPEKDFPFFDELATKYGKSMPDSKYAQEFITRVDNMRTLSVGQMAPDIALPNPEGDTVKLSSLRGKYVLIDFWAAWCRPCRMENPNVVRMYNKYNDKGFEVFGVSLDRKKEDWVNAIAQDGLTWTHVSDLAYFNSEAARLYNIQAIPATYLVGPDGKIIAKNLRGASLEEKLEEVL